MKRYLLTLISLLLFNPVHAAWISATPEVVVESIVIGKECFLRPVKFSLFVKNKGNEPIMVTIKDIQPDSSLMRAGYEPVPLLSKVIIHNNRILLVPGEKRDVDALLMFPRCSRFLGKNYQFHIAYSAVSLTAITPKIGQGTGGVGVNPGVESVVLFSTLKEMARTEIEFGMDGAGGEVNDPDVVNVNVPAGALSKKIKLIVKELRGDEIPKKIGIGGTSYPVAVFRFEPEGTVFKKPVKLSVYYPDFDNDGIVDGLDIKADTLKIFYWDGYRWEMIGGTVDLAAKCVTGDIYHFSIYGLFQAGEKSMADFIPLQKIITPATVDGKNDFISFPGLEGIYTIDIFDITGMRVVRLENKNIWYGLDEDGNRVESGTYIYKYLADVNGEKKSITGVVVVAK